MLRRWGIALALVLLAAPAAHAQVPLLLNYQGVLTDTLGTPVADGTYTLTFKLYSQLSGGGSLWTETQNNVALVRGGFSVSLGSVTTLTLPFDRPYWLGVAVSPDPEMTPRVPLSSTPYALRSRALQMPFAATFDSSAAAFTVTNPRGPAIVSDGDLNVGSSSHTGEMRVFRSGASDAFVRAGSSVRGGELECFDEANHLLAHIQPDGNGTGGFLSVLRDETSDGFVVDGNNNGTGEPEVLVSGSSRSAAFRMNNSGNASVVLPTDAISATETLDEPGVANILRSSTLFSLPAGVSTVTSRSITAPAAGYVIALGSLSLQITRTSGVVTGFDEIEFGVAASASALSTSLDYRLAFDGSFSLGLYSFPLTVHGVFPVTAGTNTFYLLSNNIDNLDCDVYDAQLTLVFVPTAYGTVSTPLAGSPGSSEQSRAGGTSVTAAEIAGERAEATAQDLARHERELTEMRAELDAIRREVETTRVTAARGRP